MFIVGLGTANPDFAYTQEECWQALRCAPQFPQLASRSQAILRKVLTGDNGIQKRTLCLPDINEAFALSPDKLHDRFAKFAPLLGASAARAALAEAGIKPEEIDAVIVSTCTGYLCPGLTSYITEELGCRRDTLNLDLVGQGCGAALPNLQTAKKLLGSCEHVLSICVEVCSAAFYLDDDAGVLISACLFGDGAAAAVLSNKPGPQRQIKWLHSGGVLIPEERELLRFEHRNGMLRNILHRKVPLVVSAHAREIFDSISSSSGISIPQIAEWILHSGGRDVLNAIRHEFGLAEADVRWSSEILRNYGNMSSPSCLYALKAARDGDGKPGLWWMSSFGAGLSCFGALLEVA